MAYDNPGPMGGGGGMAMDPPNPPAMEQQPPQGAPGEGAKPMEGEESSLFITPDMLPAGMASDIKAGDILEFKVVNPKDGDGHIEVVYNHGDDSYKEGGGKGEGEGEGMHGEEWENELRHTMSAREPSEGAA